MACLVNPIKLYGKSLEYDCDMSSGLFTGWNKFTNDMFGIQGINGNCTYYGLLRRTTQCHYIEVLSDTRRNSVAFTFR